ncbi:MAG: Mrp/NBP35 family ATP-binding protein [Deltaproteobacteria bacterium]|nr:Mrp/NBP35 family ATP-binding protein [Deltaproteobacteria bacterium]
MSDLSGVKNRIIVLSGKGGVGKSTVSVNIAAGLAAKGFKTGLMDVDFHGPSIPTMLGIKDGSAVGGENGIIPVESHGIKVISISFFVDNRDEAVIWRGPMKAGAIKQFLGDVDWGDLDYLIIDAPPGTGDEPLSVVQEIKTSLTSVIVTTPQLVSETDVRKSLNFCRKLNIPVAGVIENMSGFVCPHCGETTPIFRSGAGSRLSDEFHVPFLGTIPVEPVIGEACDTGVPYITAHPESVSSKSMSAMLDSITSFINSNSTGE